MTPNSTDKRLFSFELSTQHSVRPMDLTVIKRRLEKD